MMMSMITRVYALGIGAVSVVALIYIYAFPPASMLVTRDGVPHFTPKVAHPESGEALDVGNLIRHYRGD